MEQKRYINRAFGVLMSIFMLTAVLTKDLVKATRLTDTLVQTEDTQDDSDDSQSFITEFSSEVVIPSHAFNFGGDLAIIPVPTIKILTFDALVLNIVKPIFKNSYFDKLFEHHIAINAP
jgi:hypothetical protein